MEFPELGVHCAVESCKQLDFLPVECDACHKVFCKDHSSYEKHNCTESYMKDARVPVCPLCNQPVPVKRGEDPNIKVDQHIRNDCQSDKAKLAYTNKCSFVGCKKKELVPVKCATCQRNFCIKHRFETDHDCQGNPGRLGERGKKSPLSGSQSQGRSGAPQKTTLSLIGADLDRQRKQRQREGLPPSLPKGGTTYSQQHQMQEDEALARALADSEQQRRHHPSQTTPTSTTSTSDPSRAYNEDEALAKAIAASLNEENPKPKSTRSNAQRQKKDDKKSDESCAVS